MASTLIGKQAVVIGASVGGLTAVGAPADCFDHVLERDTLPSEGEDRERRQTDVGDFLLTKKDFVLLRGAVMYSPTLR
jgi:hypothetical protein